MKATGVALLLLLLLLLLAAVVVVVVVVVYGCLLSQAFFLPGTSLEPAVIPTAQASSFTL